MSSWHCTITFLSLSLPWAAYSTCPALILVWLPFFFFVGHFSVSYCPYRFHIPRFFVLFSSFFLFVSFHLTLFCSILLPVMSNHDREDLDTWHEYGKRKSTFFAWAGYWLIMVYFAGILGIFVMFTEWRWLDYRVNCILERGKNLMDRFGYEDRGETIQFYTICFFWYNKEWEKWIIWIWLWLFPFSRVPNNTNLNTIANSPVYALYHWT